MGRKEDSDKGSRGRVLVTGCGSGIGRACAVDLARRGWSVVATARRAGDIDGLDVAQRLALDVTDDASVADAVAAAGELDALVNNAGISCWGPVEALGSAFLERVVGTNLIGTARVTTAVLPVMRARGRGRIINVSSAAQRGFPLLGAYAASKAALEAWTEALRLEVSRFGVTVALVEPGAVDSPFGANRLRVDVPDDYKALHETALGVLTGMRSTALAADEVARAIAELLAADDPPLRTPVGDAARRIVEERRTVDDPTYEASVRQLFSIL